MALGKTLEKLAKYNSRFEAGKVKKIKPSHVQKVIDKLENRDRDLLEEVQTTNKASKRDRLERKRVTTQGHLDRARWLLNEIS